MTTTISPTRGLAVGEQYGTIHGWDSDEFATAGALTEGSSGLRFDVDVERIDGDVVIDICHGCDYSNLARVTYNSRDYAAGPGRAIRDIVAAFQLCLEEILLPVDHELGPLR